jgi:predicted dehydrogenase
MKKYTVAIIGVGNRGGDVYGRLLMKFTDRFTIVSICDRKQDRLDLFGEEFRVDPSLRFLEEDAFFAKKRADLCIIATQDRDHVRHCLKAFALGYDIMTEKPITDIASECEEMLAAQKKYGGRALVCHVLRYAPAFLKASELLKAGAIGRLVSIDATERVAYWHQAHSYVRGNWRCREESTPMILAKCCHDLDLLQ